MSVALVCGTAAGMSTAGPASALGGATAGRCRPFTAAKAHVHLAANRREVTLARLVATMQARNDPWAMNGPQVGALQAASSGITALDAHIQSTCYSDAAALRADATTLLTGYRVYWLRVPQTHGIEAADRLAEARIRLGAVAAKLMGLVAGNAKAREDLAAMNQALAATDGVLGTPPTAAPHVARLPGLAPSVDMTADVATMEAARADLVSARGSLARARADGIRVVADLGA